MSRLKAYVQAARLRTLPLASACVLTAGALALESGTCEMGGLLGAMLTVWLLQILANFANDLGDAKHGADAHRSDRAVASGAISSDAMKRAVRALAVLALTSGLATIWLADASWLWVPVGLLSMLGAYRYTAGDRPYGYAGWGDAAVMLFFGLLGVVGVAFLISGMFKFVWLLPAYALGAFSTSVLNLNNLRDHLTDAEAGKRTLVVQRGFSWGIRYHGALLLTGWIALIGMFIAMPDVWRGVEWYAVFALVHTQQFLRVRRVTADRADELDPELKRMALGTAVIALFLFLSQLNP